MWGEDGRGFENDIVQAEDVVGEGWVDRFDGELVMCTKIDERMEEAAAVQMKTFMYSTVHLFVVDNTPVALSM